MSEWDGIVECVCCCCNCWDANSRAGGSSSLDKACDRCCIEIQDYVNFLTCGECCGPSGGGNGGGGGGGVRRHLKAPEPMAMTERQGSSSTLDDVYAIKM